MEITKAELTELIEMIVPVVLDKLIGEDLDEEKEEGTGEEGGGDEALEIGGDFASMGGEEDAPAGNPESLPESPAPAPGNALESTRYSSKSLKYAKMIADSNR